MSNWDSDSLHRLAKALADSGEAETLEAAHHAFARYGVRFVLHDAVMSEPAMQIIALTAINAAARSFIGNVSVAGCVGRELSVPGFEGSTIADFANWLGLDVHRVPVDEWPTIFIGPAASDAPSGSIRPWAHGWRFGLGVCEMRGKLRAFAPAAVAVAGLAVSEAFSILRHDNAFAGRRIVDLSLWDPADPAVQGPEGPYSFPRAWLVGLGHLGQAYAWTMAFMSPPKQTVYLQDFDTVTGSSLSTSLLCSPGDIGRPKLDVVASWLRQRGYAAHLVPRRFDSEHRALAGEPSVALFGVDNAAARRACEGAGFDFIVDAGLGSGFRDFRALRVRTFPGPSTAASLWALDGAPQSNDMAPAYQRLLAAGELPCGVTTLASRAVGAPFVGCVAAGYAHAELVRQSIGADVHAAIDFNLRDPRAIQVVRSTALPGMAVTRVY